jgi:hypothetical protein
MLVAAVSLTLAPQAGAQTVPAGDDPQTPVAETAAAPDAGDADLKPGDLDWSQLNVDASTLTSGAQPKRRAAAPVPADAGASWSSKDKTNGSAEVAVKQPLWSFWDTRVCADMNVTREPATLTESQLLAERLANGGSLPRSTGTAWAAISAPGVGSIWDKTAVEARIDPAQESSRLGASLSKTLPLDDQTSLTLQNGTNLTQQSMVPVPGIAGRPARNIATEQTAKLSIADTGTSLIAGQTLSSTDDKLLHKIGAEQKLFGEVRLTGSIGETAQGTSNKSVGLGFNHSW